MINQLSDGSMDQRTSEQEEFMKGSEFRAIRLKLEMTQEQLAELLGMSGKHAISNIEIGNRNPGKLTAIVLRVLDRLPRPKAVELTKLMLRMGKED